MNGPVLAAGGELLGAVERVDDPDAVLLQTAQIIGGLFRQDAILRAVLLKDAGDPFLSGFIAGITQRQAAQQATVAYAFEDLATAIGEGVG